LVLLKTEKYYLRLSPNKTNKITIGKINNNKYEYHLGLGYPIVLNLFGNGRHITIQKTKKKQRINIRGNKDLVCVEMK
jgi:hypothetical protein